MKSVKAVRKEEIEVLRRIGWLSNCPAEVQAAIFDIATVLRLESDATVYQLGAEPGGFFGIEAGCVAFEAAQSSRAPQKGLIFHAGCWFGEVSLTGQRIRLVRARTTRPSTLVSIERRRFLALAARQPEVWRYVADLMAANLARVVGLAEDLMLRDSRQRLAGLREAFPPNPPVIDATQSEIAAIANLSRSMASPLLHELEGDGLIELSRSMILIKNPAGLVGRTS
jgi:CRP-like cAMP-binding protein